MLYEHVLRAFRDQPWYLMPEKLEQIAAFLELKAAGGDVPREEIAAIVAAAEHSAPGSPGNIAVLPLLGTISQRAGMMSEMSGGTSTERFTAAFRQVMADESVKAVIMDVDSPGGAVYGIDELASEIFAARGRKPIVAVANSLAASAAYYIASSADEVVVTPGGEVGSIGVVAVHEDWSGAYEQAGVKPTIIRAGKYKWEGNDLEPLTSEAQSAIQAAVDRYYGMFVRAVARGRGVSAQDVRNGFGEGRIVGAQEAVKLGMADRIATLDETIARFSGGGRPRVATRIAAEMISEEETSSIARSEEEQDSGVRAERLRRLAIGA